MSNYLSKIKDVSEVECVKRFLSDFNKYHKTSFKDPWKNPSQNEIDVFCGELLCPQLKIQVKKADPRISREIALIRKVPLSEQKGVFRDQDQAKESILGHIKKVADKYTKQGKDMSDIVLLLDEDFDPPSFVVDSIRKEIHSSIFKEIWMATRNNNYLLFEHRN